MRTRVRIWFCIVLLFASFVSGSPAKAQTNTTRRATADTDTKWAPFRPLLGRWRGIGQGPTGKSEVETEWKLVLGGEFLQSQSSSAAEGDHHQDVGLISYDKARRKYIYRAFHSEGFGNHYVADVSTDGRKIVFTSEAIENGPKGLRAMEIIELKDGQLLTTLKLASGGDGAYKVCASAKLARTESKD